MNTLKFAVSILALAAACLAQEGLTIRSKGKQKWPTEDAQKIYLSACSVVQREFGGNRSVAPQVILVLGADKNETWFQAREVRLKQWDGYSFAQGVVWLAFEDLMSSQQRLAIARRAVVWADSTVEIEQLAK